MIVDALLKSVLWRRHRSASRTLSARLSTRTSAPQTTSQCVRKEAISRDANYLVVYRPIREGVKNADFLGDMSGIKGGGRPIREGVKNSDFLADMSAIKGVPLKKVDFFQTRCKT